MSYDSDNDAGYSPFYSTILKSLNIGNSVTTIGEYAFSHCYKLANVTIGNSVTTIEFGAFSNCTNLANITIGNSVTTIGISAFSNCTSLANTTIPNSVTTIGNSAFAYCSSLTSIEIPNSVTTIGSSAFVSCRGLTSITIPNSVTTIGNSAFYDCIELKDLYIKDGDTPLSLGKNSTGEGLFYVCPLETLYLGRDLSYDSDFNAGFSPFSHKNTLKSLTISNSVTTIGEYAFYRCYCLTSISMPNSVTTIGNSAFKDCLSLASITSHIPAEKLFVPGSYAFDGIDKGNCTLYVPYGAKETYAAIGGWKEFANIVELPATFDLTVSAAEYSTLYLDYNAIIPEEVEVYSASTVKGNYLILQQVTGTLPANTGVIVKAEQGTYTFTESNETVEAIENNLLSGSVEDKYITPEKDTKYYVLAMKDGVVGMYEDALSGGTFKNNANKAYLALGINIGIYDEEVNTQNPGSQLSNSYYFDFSGTTTIENITTVNNDNIYYNLSGRRVENPSRGIYIQKTKDKVRKIKL